LGKRLARKHWGEDLLVAVAPVNSGRRRFRRIKVKFRTLLVGAVGLYLLFNIIQMHLTIWGLNQQLEASAQIKQELLEHQRELQEEIKQANSREYIEKLAREQLGLVKPGESLIIPKGASDN